MKLLYVKFVCVKVMVCDMCGGGGGRREEAGGGGGDGADPGYRIKNKNPTQSCGEKIPVRISTTEWEALCPVSRPFQA